MYDVARPTAKACLERLTALGLLRRSVHKTATVPELDDDDIRDLFDTRRLLEESAVTRLAQHRRLPIEVARAHQAMQAATQASDFPAQVQADIMFHWGLINGVESSRLTRVYELISGEIHLTMGQYQAHRATEPMTVLAEHAAIMTAIEAGNANAASKALETHLRLARDRVQAWHTQINNAEIA